MYGTGTTLWFKKLVTFFISLWFLQTSTDLYNIWHSVCHAHQTIELLQCKTLKFIAANLRHQNNPDLNPVDYQISGVMQGRVYQMPVEDVADLKQRLIDARCKA